jgi:hypothetical protein
MTIPDDRAPLQVALTVEARRRLSNQIARAYRGTYGARTGLRTLGRAIARRLIGAGWSPEMVSAALSRAVLDHPACAGSDRRDLVTGEQRSVALVELTRQCVEEIAFDLSQSRRPGDGTSS